MCAEHAVLPQRPIIARVNSYSIICDHNFRYIFIFSFFFFSYFSFIAFHFFLSVKTNKLSGDKSEMQFERKRTIIVTIQLVAFAIIISQSVGAGSLFPGSTIFFSTSLLTWLLTTLAFPTIDVAHRPTLPANNSQHFSLRFHCQRQRFSNYNCLMPQ